METFDPIRMLAELNALGVRFVLTSELASLEPIAVLATDRVEICVADDDEDIDRLRAMLVALEAVQDEPSDDPHRAVFRTPLGRLECREMPADGAFAELERRAGHADFGHGVIVRAASGLDTRAHVPAALDPGSQGEPVGGSVQRPEDRTPVARRLWQKLEPKLERIDDILSGKGGGP